MEKALNKLSDVLSPIAFKLDANRYLSAVKAGFFGAMSLLIIGSVFLLFANLPINGYPEFMEGLLGADWNSYFMVPYNMTMEIMTPFVMVGVAKSLANYYKVDDIGAILLALVSFFILTPSIADAGGATGIPTLNLSASGLFVGMLAAVISTEIYRWVIQKGWVIRLPESVPSNVARSFSALIPGFIVIVLFNFVRIGFSLTPFETAHAFIFQILQTPLLALARTLPTTFIIFIFEGLLWSFGIHGSNIVGAVMNPIWLNLTAENATAFSAGAELPNIINAQFYGNFVKIGGAGATLGLAICLLLFAKSQQYKTLGRLAAVPGLFNINEPLVFGLPIVLNPVLIIPFLLMPLIMAGMTYAAMALNLVPLTNGANIPWTTPPIISGLLLSGWRGAVLQVFQIGVSAAVYYPFFRIVDQKAYQLETEGTEGIEAVEEGGVQATQPTEA
ncbi:PTS cellobiose transporter subunit IIC [Marinilactibacillus piezotolerans]|uniref:PTS cellobiose transporter subunit IIC n=1 Tax=Marinilactibacillus piezotolerans TaxID=258723 RepID=UPI0009AFB582|nr:PTS cellobiose transporter subunit IIC [Marinilactibacillus piezotolerans]